jgi:aldose 1-epimerase
MEASATTDAPTLVNMVQHSYFNLDDSTDVLDHTAQIFAGAYTPTDERLIPTGEIVSVAGSDFDFRAPRPIRHLRGGGRIAYDKTWVVDRVRSSTPRLHAKLSSPKSRVTLAVSSTEPGLQFYDGSYLAVPVPGLGGRRYGPLAGCCLEPGVFPDAPNHRGFPSAILRPGETYRQVTTFAFSRD